MEGGRVEWEGRGIRMVQVYYKMSHGTYKKHAHRIQGHWHTEDAELTDSSVILLKATGEDHMHDYIEKQEGVSWTQTPIFASPHPLVRHRGL